MEKLKNFAYDISDLLFSLIIIAIIFAVVSWKLTDVMQINWFSNINENPIEIDESMTASSLDKINNLPANEPTVSDTTVTEVTEVSEVNETTTTDTEEKKPEAEATTETNKTSEGKNITFTVKSGSTGYKIAKNLKNQGIIDDVNTFIKKLDEMKLANKLRSGKFKLNTNMSLEEIIKILAGKK